MNAAYPTGKRNVQIAKKSCLKKIHTIINSILKNQRCKKLNHAFLKAALLKTHKKQPWISKSDSDINGIRYNYMSG